jgi:hypothetical protein
MDSGYISDFAALAGSAIGRPHVSGGIVAEPLRAIHRGAALKFVGSEPSNVDQCRDFWVRASLGDHDAAAGVAREDNQSPLRNEHALGSRHVVTLKNLSSGGNSV